MKEEKASRMRKAIATNMVDSWHTSPKCDFFMTLDAEPMMAFRKEYNEKNGVKISFLSMVMKAASIALTEFPYVNSKYDFENHKHIFNDTVNVGFAHALPNNGLIVMNVKDTDKIDLVKITDEVNRLVPASDKGQIALDDITGGSITINNMGKYKTLKYHTAIINKPELSILSIYNISDEVVADGDQVRIKKCMNIALSADHRVIDGEMACEFLARVIELLEKPESLV